MAKTGSLRSSPDECVKFLTAVYIKKGHAISKSLKSYALDFLPNNLLTF